MVAIVLCLEGMTGIFQQGIQCCSLTLERIRNKSNCSEISSQWLKAFTSPAVVKLPWIGRALELWFKDVSGEIRRVRALMYLWEMKNLV
jgi:hypothetical protein